MTANLFNKRLPKYEIINKNEQFNIAKEDYSKSNNEVKNETNVRNLKDDKILDFFFVDPTLIFEEFLKEKNSNEFPIKITQMKILNELKFKRNTEILFICQQ